MERFSDNEDIGAALATLRPSPRPGFAAELDERVAAGFPPAAKARRFSLVTLRARFRGLSPQRFAFASAGTAIAAIVIATVVVASVDSGTGPKTAGPQGSLSSEFSGAVPSAPSRRLTEPNAAVGASGGSVGEQSASAAPSYGSDAPLSRPAHREIERSAEIGLLADPADVADDSAQVFSAVHDVRGIVLRSNTTQGAAGQAGAHFDLLIPSSKLGDALAAFSAIDEVGSRHEATADITAPTVAVADRLRDSQAKIGALLTQLSAAETEAEADANEAELRRERRRAARLGARLDNLHRRTTFSRVSLRIETGAPSASSGGGIWGVEDALGDAGHILGIAAGVTVVGLAILTPLALIVLLTWLAQRTWVRFRRQQALSRRV